MALEQDSVTAERLNDVVVEQAPDAVIFADVHGVIRLWNRRAEEIFGYSAAEVVGRSLNILIPERLREAHWSGFTNAVKTGETKYGGKVLTTRSAHKDGRTLYVDLSFALLRERGGSVLGALAIARDITEQHLESKALRERLRSLEARNPQALVGTQSSEASSNSRKSNKGAAS